MTRRAALVLATAVLLAGCAPQTIYDTRAACVADHPGPAPHCVPEPRDGGEVWRATIWYGDEEECEAAHGGPCQAGMCETGCPPYVGGSGWAGRTGSTG